MKIVGRILTIVLGAIPASYMSFLALMGIDVGLEAAFGGEIFGLVFAAWGLAGVYGTFSLWAVGLGFVRAWSVAGLVVGIAALMPFTETIDIAGVLSRPARHLLDIYALVCPVVVAAAWLTVLAARQLRRRAWT